MQFNFEPDFDGIEVWLNIFHTNKTDASLYNNWTFPTELSMDNFYYDNNTEILLNTPGVTIGKTSLKHTRLKIKFNLEKDIGVIFEKKILYVPIQFGDRILNKIIFKKSELKF